MSRKNIKIFPKNNTIKIIAGQINMGDTRPVFAFIAADSCGACRAFKPKWPEIKSSLESLRTIRVVEIFVPTTGTKVDKNKAPEDINNLIGYFPLLALFTGRSWNEGKLVGEAFNATKDGRRFIPSRGKYSMDKNGIMAWVNDVLKNPNFQGTGQSSIQPNIMPRNPYGDTRYVPTSGSKCSGINIISKRN